MEAPPNGPPGGGNPFGADGPFGPGGMDEWMRRMGIDPRDFQRLFDDMQRNLEEAFRNMGDDPSKGFVSGFNFRMGPDGKPQFNTFGNKPHVKRPGGQPGEVSGTGKPGISIDEREPLTDVIEDAVSVATTMELPGVDKSDIDLKMTEDSLEISVDTERRKYHKRVRLPAKVDPSTTKATYNNGILDVTVQKVRDGSDGVRITID